MLREKSTVVVKIVEQSCAGVTSAKKKAAAANISMWLVENGKQVGCMAHMHMHSAGGTYP